MESPVLGFVAWNMRNPVPHSPHLMISRWKSTLDALCNLLLEQQQLRSRQPMLECENRSGDVRSLGLNLDFFASQSALMLLAVEVN